MTVVEADKSSKALYEYYNVDKEVMIKLGKITRNHYKESVMK